MKVNEIIKHLRDWKTGRYFRDLAVEHANADLPLTESAMRELANRAKTDETKTVDPKATYAVEDSYPLGPWTATVAETLDRTAERIATVIPKNKPLVLLGRDTWPLVPLLRARGFDTQYFLWSRANERDPQTYSQWMKEVKPGSTVIDTGYTGSIINWIREKDTTASGLLMSKSDISKYDQILDFKDHSDRVDKIEGLVKFINRSKTYTSKGSALLAKDENDEDVALRHNRTDGMNRWIAQGLIRDTLRRSGLPQWDVWRYSQFVGLTPEERLGVNSREEVNKHYELVQQKRALWSPASSTFTAE
jgi:hypothetical protein